MISHDDFEGLGNAIDKNTKAIFCESISNPAGNIVDMEKLAKIAHKQSVPLIVYNTVATPYLCRPFELGTDHCYPLTNKIYRWSRNFYRWGHY